MSLTLAQDRKLVRDTSRCTRYLIATVQAPEQDDGVQRSPLNVALVIDRSGSMAGAKIAQARDAASYALGLLDDGDRVAIVAYDEIISVLMPSAPATAHNVARARAAIATLAERGVTNLSEGWLTGCREIADHLAAGQVARCLLLTDGLANRGITDGTQLEQHARQLRLRGVATSTFGIGEDFNEHLLSRMSVAGGGNFRLIRDAEEIPRLLREELVEGLEVVASNAELLVRVPAGVTVRPLGDFEMRHTPAGEAVLSLGDLLSEQRLAVVLRLDFAPGGPATELTCELRLRDAKDCLDTRTHSVSFIRAPDHANDEQARDREVDRRIGALHAARTRREALARNRAGDYQGARQLIDACIVRLRRYAGDDAELLRLIAELEQAQRECAEPMDALYMKAVFGSSSATMRGRSLSGSAQRFSRMAKTRVFCLSPQAVSSVRRAVHALAAADFTLVGHIQPIDPADQTMPPAPQGDVLSTVEELALVDQMRNWTKGGVNIGLVNARLYDNWFSHWHAAGRAAIVSMHGLSELISVDLAAYVAYEIVLNGLANASPEYDLLNFVHDETRGCLFDLCPDKRDMEVKLQATHLCTACSSKLHDMRIDLAQMARATDVIRELARPVARAALV